MQIFPNQSLRQIAAFSLLLFYITHTHLNNRGISTYSFSQLFSLHARWHGVCAEELQDIIASG